MLLGFGKAARRAFRISEYRKEYFYKHVLGLDFVSLTSQLITLLKLLHFNLPGERFMCLQNLSHIEKAFNLGATILRRIKSLIAN
jgi:hypothetical protein